MNKRRMAVVPFGFVFWTMIVALLQQGNSLLFDCSRYSTVLRTPWNRPEKHNHYTTSPRRSTLSKFQRCCHSCQSFCGASSLDGGRVAWRGGKPLLQTQRRRPARCKRSITLSHRDDLEMKTIDNDDEETIISLEDIEQWWRQQTQHNHTNGNVLSVDQDDNNNNNNNTLFQEEDLDTSHGKDDKSNSNDDETTTMVHHFFINLALDEARKAAERGEVPVGALVVQNQTNSNVTESSPATAAATTASVNTTTFRILSRASNRVEERLDASAHAELLAMRQAAQRVGNWRLYETTLYTTLEPCVICCAAAQAFRVDQIVYGAPDVRLGATGGRNDIDNHNHQEEPFNLLSMAPHPFHNISKVVGGIQREACAYELQDFFRQRRKQQKEARRRERNKALQENLTESASSTNATTSPLASPRHDPSNNSTRSVFRKQLRAVTSRVGLLLQKFAVFLRKRPR